MARINFESANQIVQDAFIPKEQRTGMRYSFLEDLVPVVQYYNRQKSDQLNRVSQSTSEPSIDLESQTRARLMNQIFSPPGTAAQSAASAPQASSTVWVNPNRSSSSTTSYASTGDRPYFDLIKKYFPQDAWENAYRVMMAESGGNPTIPSGYNKYGTEESYGLFQINLQAHPQMRDTVLNPEENVKYAAQLYSSQGWRPWYNTAKKLGLL